MAISLDGSSGLYRNAPLGGISDSGKGTILLWLKMDADTGGYTLLNGRSTSVGNVLRFNWSSGFLLFFLYHGTGTVNLQLTSSDTILSADGYTGVLISYDLANSLYYMYKNNTDVTSVSLAPSVDSVNLDAVTNWGVGLYNNNGSFSSVFEGDLGFIAFWPGVYVDLTDSDERRKLISNDGKPVGFGVDGSANFDTKPVILFSGAFTKNFGTGGAFSTLGTLSSARSPDCYRPSSDRLTYGTRWYDSDRSGWGYPRNEMVRERSGRKGQRVGIDEADEPDRDDYKEVDFNDLIDGEEDHEDVV